MGGFVRWADLLCGGCIEEVLDDPVGFRHRFKQLGEENVQCGRCRARIGKVVAAHGGGVTQQPFGNLGSSARRAMVAAHEAGHTVAGLEFGYSFVEARVNEQAESSPLGHATFEFFESDTVVPAELGAFSAAGKFAQLRWLREQGLLRSTADRIDLHWAGNADLLNVDRALGGVPDGVLERGADLVNANWSRIRRFGDSLARTGHVDAADLGRVLPADDSRGPDRGSSYRSDSAPRVPIFSTTASQGGPSMSGIEEIRGTLSRATEETEQAQHALAQAMERIESARAAVAQAALSSSRDEIQQVLASFGHVGDELREVGGRMAVSVDQVRTYAAQL